MRRDHVDIVLGEAGRGRPDRDVSPVAVTARILRAARFLESGFDAGLARSGLSYSEFDVLATLRRVGSDEGLAPSAIAHSLMLSRATITGRLDRLEAAGYVRRRPDRSDRRGLLVGLTAKGRKVIDEALPPYRANLDRLIAPLRDRERTRLAGLLRKLLLAFEAEAAGGAGPRRSAPP